MGIEIIPSELGMTPARLDTSGKTHQCPYLEDLLHVLLATHGRSLHGHLLGHLSCLVGSWGSQRGEGDGVQREEGKVACVSVIYFTPAGEQAVYLSIYQSINLSTYT